LPVWRTSRRTRQAKTLKTSRTPTLKKMWDGGNTYDSKQEDIWVVEYHYLNAKSKLQLRQTRRLRNRTVWTLKIDQNSTIGDHSYDIRMHRRFYLARNQ
jgi:hypothetical protein